MSVDARALLLFVLIIWRFGLVDVFRLARV